MNERIREKNSVVNAKIHPKVVAGLSTFKKLVDGTIESPATKVYCKKKLMDKK